MAQRLKFISGLNREATAVLPPKTLKQANALTLRGRRHQKMYDLEGELCAP